MMEVAVQSQLEWYLNDIKADVGSTPIDFTLVATGTTVRELTLSATVYL